MGALLRAAIATSLAAVVACDSNQPPSSPPAGSGGGTVSGTERLAWVQGADNINDISIYQYAAYVDGARRVLQGVTCNPTSATAADCTVALPALGAGRHTLEVAAFFTAGEFLFESLKSSSIEVTVAGVVASSAGGFVEGGEFEGPDGLRLFADVLARDLDQPTDLAVDHDNRVFVAERHAGLRIIDPGDGSTAAAQAIVSGREANAPALLSLTLAPDFPRSHHVYVGYATLDGDRPEVHVARLREAGGRLGEAAVITSQPADSIDSASVIRFGPDGALYVGTSAVLNADDAQRLASPSGKVLRLHPDGSTPADNPSRSPLFSYGHREPRGLAWHPAGALWETERGNPEDEMNVLQGGGNYGWPGIASPAIDGAGVRRRIPARLMLPPDTQASGVAIVSLPGHPLYGDLVVSTEATRDLLRIRLTPDGQRANGTPASLLQGRFGRIAQVAAGPDGAIYFVTANQDTWGPASDVLVRLRVDR